jgi:hypothetical protein
MATQDIPQPIQRWPGKMSSEYFSKVRTAVAYQQNDCRKWGFECDDLPSDYDVKRSFKLHLDSHHQSSNGEQSSTSDTEEARQYFHDYLNKLWHTSKHEIGRCFGVPEKNVDIWFHGLNIDFLFSVPDTWHDSGMWEKFEELIKNTELGQNPEKHCIQLRLTESEATVIATLNCDKVGEVLLVCDAGGGTVDVGILQVTACGDGIIHLKPLVEFAGVEAGST